jgi:hypothetical protein
MNDRTPQPHDRRTDLRTLDRHHGHREVYHALDAVAGQDHNTRDEQRDDEPVDLDVAEPPRETDELLTEAKA